VKVAVASVLCAVERVIVLAAAVRLGTTMTTSVGLEELTETVPSYGLAGPAPLIVTVGAVEPIFRFSPVRVTVVVEVVGPLEGETFWIEGAPT
jgi:hypothetical protein